MVCRSVLLAVMACAVPVKAAVASRADAMRVFMMMSFCLLMVAGNPPGVASVCLSDTKQDGFVRVALEITEHSRSVTAIFS